MNEIIILGDSHTHSFASKGPRHTDDPALFTSRDYGELITSLYSDLTKFLKTNPAKNLIVCLGEVEIRAHWWKHITTEYANGNSIQNYIKVRVKSFYDSLKFTADLYNLEKIVLFGAPPAMNNTVYNPSWPFIGSTSTRNIMIHMFNCEFIKAITEDIAETRIGFATGFYHCIDQNTYEAVDNILSDGLHWSSELDNNLFSLVELVINEDGYFTVGPAFEHMKDHEFYLSHLTKSAGNYDTWVNANDLENADLFTRNIIVDGEKYHFLTINQRKDIEKDCRELSILKRE